MVQQKWILLALVGVVLICKASGLDCVQCNTEEADCISGDKPATACEGALSEAKTCYVRITDGKVDRGCSLNDEEVNCSENDGTACKKCNTPGCNKFTWPRCHQCTTDDSTCSNAQDGVGSYCGKYKPQDQAGGKCYERFVGGTVERGCEIDLKAQPADVCEGDEECKSCANGDGCNKEAGREFQVTRCVQCVTSVDADGTCLDGSKAATNCANPSDKKCYSKVLEDGSLEQGCHSELVSPDTCTGSTCNICEGDECNKRVFPENRLGCYQCQKSGNDADCEKELTGDAKAGICKKYKEGDKCYSRVKAGSSFERGCQSDLAENEQVCTGLVNCFECEGKNCNSLSEEKLKASTKCQRCNSDDPACLTGTAPAQSCGQENDACFVRINSAGKLERNCVSTLTDDSEKIKCNTETDKTCIGCKATSTESACNNQKWLKCHKCSGTNQNCLNEQAGAPEFCTNYRESGKCYERFVDGKEVQRGCESDLSPETENVCVGNQQCKTCSTEEGGCNKDVSTVFQVTKCVQCKSDADADGTCLKGTKEETNCENPDGKCFSRIVTGGILERGCRSALPEADQTACTGELCNLCGEAACNKGVFPANRAQCYRCHTSADDKTCAAELSGDAKSEICGVYKEGDKCFSRVTAALNFERGCQSDLGDNANACADLNDCKECEGPNCNGLSEERLKSWTKCLQCDTDDEACNEATVKAANCGVEVDSCLVRINDGKLERKCLSSLSETDQAKCTNANDQSCVTCTGSGCNEQKWIKCHQCEGSTIASCNAAQEDAALAVYCPKYKENNQCYERLESETVVRGCSSDLNEAPCSNSLECKVCEGNACNKDAANTLQTSQRCLQCSTASDAGGLCLAGTTSPLPCTKDSESKCFFQVQTDGQLKRGCKGDLSASEVTACTGTTCKICNEPSCNIGVYPESRLRCYQCKSSDDENCHNELQGPEKSAFCKLYKEGDKCYSRDVSDDLFERGCQSDLGLETDACKDLDSLHCHSCDEADCNAISKKTLNGAGAVALNVVLLGIVLFLGVFSVL